MAPAFSIANDSSFEFFSFGIHYVLLRQSISFYITRFFMETGRVIMFHCGQLAKNELLIPSAVHLPPSSPPSSSLPNEQFE